MARSTSGREAGERRPVNGRFAALMYHRLIDTPESKYDVTPAAFTAQLTSLRDQGYTVEGFAGLERRRASGSLPGRYAVITFDDGHRSALRAAEIVARFGVGATFFLTRDLSLERPEFVTVTEMRELARLAEVGSHGVSHRPLNRIPITEAVGELVDSKAWLEDVLGNPVESLSLPGGFCNPTVLRLARQAGYGLVGNSCEWWNREDAIWRRGVVNRIVVQSHYDTEMFRRLVGLDWGTYLWRRLRYEASWNITNHLPRPLSRNLIRIKHKILSDAVR
jgi:peptidoglycan/xylan/chitin deacetylase (PgdA/CDA1 family)